MEPIRVISGTALTLTGGGTTILNNADTYTGGTTLQGGTLSIGNPTGLGSGALMRTAASSR